MIQFIAKTAVAISLMFATSTPPPPTLLWDRNPEPDMKEYQVYYASVVATPYDCLCCEDADPDTSECLTFRTCTCYSYQGPWDPVMPTPWMLGDTVPQPETGTVTTGWDSGTPSLHSLFVFRVCAVDQAGNVDLECPVIPPSQQAAILLAEMEETMKRIDLEIGRIEAAMATVEKK